MTEEQRKPHVAEALVRAQEASRAAEALLAAGLHRDAVSRAYYVLTTPSGRCCSRVGWRTAPTAGRSNCCTASS